MEIEGRLLYDLGIQQGTSKAGNPWKKREMVFETFGAYPKKVKFTIFGDQRVDGFHLEIGKDYVFSVDVESREFNGRWYTDVNLFNYRDYTGQPAAGAPSAPASAPYPQAPQAQPSYSQATVATPPQGFAAAPADSEEDLPF